VKAAWFATFLDLPHGIPSHDTFNRVFAALDPVQFRACFLHWMEAVAAVLPTNLDALPKLFAPSAQAWSGLSIVPSDVLPGGATAL
jgi:hypothetical protein